MKKVEVYYDGHIQTTSIIKITAIRMIGLNSDKYWDTVERFILFTDEEINKEIEIIELELCKYSIESMHCYGVTMKFIQDIQNLKSGKFIINKTTIKKIDLFKTQND